MSAVAIPIALVLLGLILVADKLIKSRRRRSRLSQRHQIASLEEAGGRVGTIAKVIETNFGFGRETWLVTDSEEIDLETRCFKRGVLIWPRPPEKRSENFATSDISQSTAYS